MEPLESKCYHSASHGGSQIQTVSVGTQSTCMDAGIGNGSGNSNNCATGANGELTLTNSKAQLNSGNYINIVPMPMGVQYHHRRKYSPQIQSEYQ